MSFTSMYVASLISIRLVYTFQDMSRISNHYEKMGDNSVIYRVGLWFMCTALPLTAIYL